MYPILHRFSLLVFLASLPLHTFGQSLLEWVGGTSWNSTGYNWEDVNNTPTVWQNGLSAMIDLNGSSLTVDGSFNVSQLLVEDGATFNGGTLNVRYLDIRDRDTSGSISPVIFNTNLTGSDLDRRDGAGLFSSVQLYGVGNNFSGNVNLNSGYTTLAGPNGALQIGSNLFIGGSGSSTSATYTAHSGGETTVSGSVELGLSAHGGQLYLDHAGTSLDVTGHLWAGRTNGANTTINVFSGSSISVGTTLSLGDIGGSVGTLNLSGSGSSVHAGSLVYVGWAGTGILNVTGGASFSTSEHIFLSHQATGTGTLNVSGANSSVSAASFLWTSFVGGTSSAVTISAGGNAQSGLTFSIADAEETTGTLDITGEGSMASSGTAFHLGYEGAATTTLSSGGSLQAGTVLSLATVAGSSSVVHLNDGGTLIVGGDNGILQGGGTVTFNLAGGTIRNRDGGSGGTLSTSVAMALSNSSTIDTAGGSATFSGVLSGNGNLAKSGAGTLTLAAENTYTGTTTVAAGTLQIDGTLASSAVSVESGATLAGAGTLTGAVTIENGGTIAPGSSPGTLEAGSMTFSAGGIYVWEINDALGAMGSDPGWDLIDLADVLTIEATSENPFVIEITSLDLANDLGLATNFDNTASYTWTIAFASSGIQGFDVSKFLLEASGFQNDLGTGAFDLQVDGNALQLTFGLAPVPEPATWAMFLGLVGLGSAYFRRRRRKS